MGLSTLRHWRRKITSATKRTAPGCIPDYEPFPFRQRKKRRKVGPFSKRLSFAMLDLRTQEGRYARDICDSIAADLGVTLVTFRSNGVHCKNTKKKNPTR